jgi:hypothetical protein
MMLALTFLCLVDVDAPPIDHEQLHRAPSCCHVGATNAGVLYCGRALFDSDHSWGVGAVEVLTDTIAAKSCCAV